MKSLRIGVRVFAACLALGAFTFSIHARPTDPNLDVTVQIVGEEIRSQVSLFVEAPRERVWDVITDYERAPQYTRDLEVSRVLSRSGEVLRLFQRLLVRFGPFAVPLETVREVRLSAPHRAVSRLVSGSMKSYESTTELTPEGGGTRVTYRSKAVPDSFLAGFVGEGSIREQTADWAKHLRAEILRRERHAAAVP